MYIIIFNKILFIINLSNLSQWEFMVALAME